MDEDEVLAHWIAEIHRRVLQKGTGRPFTIVVDDVINASGATLPDKREEDALKVALCDRLEAQELILPHDVAGVPDALALTSKGANPDEWQALFYY